MIFGYEQTNDLYAIRAWRRTLTMQIRTQCYRLAFGIAAFLTPVLGTAADEMDRKLPLDGVDRLVYSGVWILASEVNSKCRVDYEQIVTSMKFVLNTAQIPLLEYGELEISLPPFQLLPPDDDNSAEAIKVREQQAARDNGLNTPDLSVSGDLLATEAGCIYQLTIEISEGVQATKTMYSHKGFSGRVPLWRAGYYGIAPASDLTDTLSKRVEIALKEFVNDREEDIRKAQ